MYNLTVAEAHTFFVGQQGWLVHNKCPDVVMHPSKRAARYAAQRDAGMGIHGDIIRTTEDFREGSRPRGAAGDRHIMESSRTGIKVHHDPYGHKYSQTDLIGPHYGVDYPDDRSTMHHLYPSNHDPSTNR